MRVEVFFGVGEVAPADLQGRVVAVIDVLRASTTIAVALHNGARRVIPCESADEAVTRARAFERGEIRLAGERKMLPIPGFDLGNSPREFVASAIDGRSILLTTTNGTVALLACQGAREVIVASYVNRRAVLGRLRAALRAGLDVVLLCAGKERQFALEDAACAGSFVRGLSMRGLKPALNDGAAGALLLDRRYGHDIPRLFLEAEHAAALSAAGFAADLDVCAAPDTHPIIPVYSDRQITRHGPKRGTSRSA